MTDLCALSAVELRALLHARKVSAVELMQACITRIEQSNPGLNAIVTLRDPDALLAEAAAADHALASGKAIGTLHGLPYGVKDLHSTAGLLTTFGSALFRDYLPAEDELCVARAKQAGAIVVGKTNTPEFGAGSQTFNALFGATRNPYDTRLTCGGSSGGSAVALATGMVALADGSDFGGSLRNPASFCNVVGFRPSPGRLPRLAADAWDTLSVQGPMARTVADAALLLSALAGPDLRDPLSIQEPGMRFRVPLERDFAGCRVAWSRNLGRYPVQTAVTATLEPARSVFASLGCRVVDVEPDFSGVDTVFQTLRAAAFAGRHAADLTAHPEALKATVRWNIEQGLALRATDLMRAQQLRTTLYARLARLFEDCDFLLLPVTQVTPFDVEHEWVEEIEGVRLQTYIDWMGTCYAISCMSVPAISVPAGFTSEGLPVGLQIVGRPQQDFAVLQIAHAYEQVTHFGRRQPNLFRADQSREAG
jgi:amidase